MFLFFVWDFSKVAFVIPYFNVAIYWYSLFFALGLYGALLIGKKLLKDRSARLGHISTDDAISLDTNADRLFTYLFIGILVGARLGHVIFYDLSYYKSHLVEILNLRQGGLSSHGGILGLLIALYFFNRRLDRSPLFPKGRDMLDLLAICSGWAAFCIRCGNLMNQEIVGIPSSLPWAIIFTEPLEGMAGIPRHPAQAYEALVSLSLLGVFLFVGRGGRWCRGGKIAGIYLLLTFVARFFIEMIKAPQCEIDRLGMHMGQTLSLPILVLAIYLIFTSPHRKGKR